MSSTNHAQGNPDKCPNFLSNLIQPRLPSPTPKPVTLKCFWRQEIKNNAVKTRNILSVLLSVIIFVLKTQNSLKGG